MLCLPYNVPAKLHGIEALFVRWSWQYTQVYVCKCMHSHIIYTHALNIGIYAHVITYTFNMGTHMHTDLSMTYDKHKGYLRSVSVIY